MDQEHDGQEPSVRRHLDVCPHQELWLVKEKEMNVQRNTTKDQRCSTINFLWQLVPLVETCLMPNWFTLTSTALCLRSYKTPVNMVGKSSDFTSLLLPFLMHPHLTCRLVFYTGFEFVDRGCCGSGTLEAAFSCNSLTPTCPDASVYIFWDSYHPAERTYKILVSQALQRYGESFL